MTTECSACKGACVVENSDKVMQTCPVCKGSGVRITAVREGLVRSGGAQPGETFAK